MSDSKIKPEIIVFAGPNGSGKSTITKFAKTVGTYINADDIKRVNHCSDLDAAQIVEKMLEDALEKGIDFTFETVLSTERKVCGGTVTGIHRDINASRKTGFYFDHK